jgi:polyphosphate kinase
MSLDDPAYYMNRELSWLDFNTRVLAEAEREEKPLLERLKFLAITSSNLDEFFMIRVAMLHRAVEARTGPLGPDGLTSREALDRVREKAQALVRRQYDCLEERVLPLLAREGIERVRAAALSPEDRDALRHAFEDRILPVLTPLTVDPSHPFPLLANGALYILFRIALEAPEDHTLFGQTDTVLVQVPQGIDRIVRLPGGRGAFRFALLEDVIALFAGDLLGGYRIEAAVPFRVTRDADFTVDDEQAENLMTAIQEQLRSRRKGKPVRLEVGKDAPEALVRYLTEELGLAEPDVYHLPPWLDLRCGFEILGNLDRADLEKPSWPPQPHPRLRGERDLFEAIREEDLLLHHPYQSFDPVVELLQRAADDPDVLAIKVTLYRVSGDSPVVGALIRAAESGKQVTALVELRARFDEETNITWAERLDEAGAHVIYGVVGYKTHSKALLVVRREEGGIRRYVHLGTGNYNDRTARLYTDFGYLTARPAFGADVSAFFNVITGYALPPRWRRIEMAPTGLRTRFAALIEREIEKHTPETPGFIRFKMNSLIDPGMIRLLYRASQAGVRVEGIVRGMCRLRAGVPGLSENIRIVSILDRFLEHSRIYHFHNGGQEELYLASADWMERNLNRRIELLFPVLDDPSRREVLRCLGAGLADNVQAWELRPNNTYAQLHPREGGPARRSQEILYREACKAVEAEEEASLQGTFEAKTKPAG